MLKLWTPKALRATSRLTSESCWQIPSEALAGSKSSAPKHRSERAQLPRQNQVFQKKTNSNKQIVLFSFSFLKFFLLLPLSPNCPKAFWLHPSKVIFSRTWSAEIDVCCCLCEDVLICLNCRTHFRHSKAHIRCCGSSHGRSSPLGDQGM